MAPDFTRSLTGQWREKLHYSIGYPLSLKHWESNAPFKLGTCKHPKLTDIAQKTRRAW